MHDCTQFTRFLAEALCDSDRVDVRHLVQRAVNEARALQRGRLLVAALVERVVDLRDEADDVLLAFNTTSGSYLSWPMAGFLHGHVFASEPVSDAAAGGADGGAREAVARTGHGEGGGRAPNGTAARGQLHLPPADQLVSRAEKMHDPSLAAWAAQRPKESGHSSRRVSGEGADNDLAAWFETTIATPMRSQFANLTDAIAKSPLKGLLSAEQLHEMAEQQEAQRRHREAVLQHRAGISHAKSLAHRYTSRLYRITSVHETADGRPPTYHIRPLVHRDYADFVRLSTELEGVDNMLMECRRPVLKLRKNARQLREAAAHALEQLQSGATRNTQLQSEAAHLERV